MLEVLGIRESQDLETPRRRALRWTGGITGTRVADNAQLYIAIASTAMLSALSRRGRLPDRKHRQTTRAALRRELNKCLTAF